MDDFPSELHCAIVRSSNLSKSDLCSLRLVSRNLSEHVNVILRTDVFLNDSPHIQSWIQFIADHPDLAILVKYLKLSLPFQDQLPSRYRQKLKNTLGHCRSLKELVVHRQDYRELGPTLDPIELLRGHTFRLEKFKNSYFRLDNLQAFFQEQNSLRVLTISCKEPGSTLPAGFRFPENLASLILTSEYLSDVLGSGLNLHGGKLLDVHVGETWEDDIPFSPSAACHLRRLSFEFFNDSGSSTPAIEVLEDILNRVAQWRAPKLEYLRVIAHTSVCDLYHRQARNLCLLYSKTKSKLWEGKPDDMMFDMKPWSYPMLKTIIWQPLHGAPDEWVVGAHPRRLATAKRLMGAVPSLRRVVIIWDGPWEFVRDGEGGVVDTGLVELSMSEWEVDVEELFLPTLNLLLD
jgi:hypothetical protein